MKPKHIKQLQAEGKHLKVRRVDRNVFIVDSSSEEGHRYVVKVTIDKDDVIHTHCTCPWAEHHGIACSHAIATLEYLAEKRDRTLSFWLTEEDAKRQKHRVFFMTGEEDTNDRHGIWITSRSA